VKRQSEPSTSGLTIFCPNPVITTLPGSYDDDDEHDDDSNNDDPLTKQSFKFTELFHCLLCI
jgi:hypothetical protein